MTSWGCASPAPPPWRPPRRACSSCSAGWSTAPSRAGSCAPTSPWRTWRSSTGPTPASCRPSAPPAPPTPGGGPWACCWTACGPSGPTPCRIRRCHHSRSTGPWSPSAGALPARLTRPANALELHGAEGHPDGPGRLAARVPPAVGAVGAEVQGVAGGEAEGLAVDLELQLAFEQVDELLAGVLHRLPAAVRLGLDAGRRSGKEEPAVWTGDAVELQSRLGGEH